MSVESKPCPPIELLQQLGDSGQEPMTFQHLEDHIEHCRMCQTRLQELAGAVSDDSISLAQSLPDNPPDIPGLKILRQIGHGGSAVVYEAVQLPLERKVALKVLHPDKSALDRTRRHWLMEAKALCRIRHPNVVTLFDAGEHNQQMYLVLDLIPGGTLNSRIHGPLLPRDAARIVEIIARATDALHQAGFLHLDIKPSNILLDTSASYELSQVTPLLSDFGISRESAATEADKQSNSIHRSSLPGTPAFMAPEQFNAAAGAVGPATDVFALGATLYTLLTGRPPFQTPGTQGVAEQLIDCRPVAPQTIVPHIPAELQTICLVCLSKDPALRYSSPGDLADALCRWIHGNMISRQPASVAAHRLLSWKQRPYAAAIVLTTTLLAALSVLRMAPPEQLPLREEQQTSTAPRQSDHIESTPDRSIRQLAGLLQSFVNSSAAQDPRRSTEILQMALCLNFAMRRAQLPDNKQFADVVRLNHQVVNHFQRLQVDKELRLLLSDAAKLTEILPLGMPHESQLARLCFEIRTQHSAMNAGSQQAGNGPPITQSVEDAIPLSILDGNSPLITETADEICREAWCAMSGGVPAADVAAASRRTLIDVSDRLQSSANPHAALIQCVAQKAQALEIHARRQGLVFMAHRTVDWMLQLGTQLLDIRTNTAAAHYLLSKGHEHRAKLAWAASDPAAAEESLRLALFEANFAARAEPERQEYTQHAAGIQFKVLDAIATVTETP